MIKHYGEPGIKATHVTETNDTYPARRVRIGPEEEQYASSDESEHEGDDIRENVEYRTFTRVDHAAKRYRTSNEQGPEWSLVCKRETYDLHTGELLESLNEQELQTVTRATLYAPVKDGPRDIKTVLT